MNLNKALWERGDFTKIAALMRQSGNALVKSIGVTRSLRVLDLGRGDGTTAVPLALLGAEVVGIDIAGNLVAAGNRRAAEAGLSRLKFQQGDAANLEGISDHSFDLTLSVFGCAPQKLDPHLPRVVRRPLRVQVGPLFPRTPYCQPGLPSLAAEAHRHTGNCRETHRI